ncbi:MAG: rRNA maturation RNase YbeY [Chloroflexi bacterium]|nr:rRNA maturation RNase YbeY [Chloroflexota bacterium]
MIGIQVEDAFRIQLQSGRLKLAAQAVLNDQSVSPSAELTIVVSGDDELRRLNKEFLGKDSPTDVLSFPSGEVDPDSGNLYLGDILISFPRAQEQAQVTGHPVSAELDLLVVHGVLHLLGYDHDTDTRKVDMWTVQSRILAVIGSPITSPPD